jgi:hypothetical protein
MEKESYWISHPVCLIQQLLIEDYELTAYIEAIQGDNVIPAVHPPPDAGHGG